MDLNDFLLLSHHPDIQDLVRQCGPRTNDWLKPLEGIVHDGARHTAALHVIAGTLLGVCQRLDICPYCVLEALDRMTGGTGQHMNQSVEAQNAPSSEALN